MTNQEEQEIIFKNDSEKGRHAVSFLWSKLSTKEARKERMAVVNYARQIKLYGTESADLWIKNRFGEARGTILLSTNPFKKQRIRYM